MVDADKLFLVRDSFVGSIGFTGAASDVGRVGRVQKAVGRQMESGIGCRVTAVGVGNGLRQHIQREGDERCLERSMWNKENK